MVFEECKLIKGDKGFSMNQLYKIDVEELWKTIGSFAIVEDADKYIMKLDESLKEVPEDSVLYFVGKSPIWLYCIMVGRVISKRPDIILFYSKPTSSGHRKFKIYPW